MWCSDVENPAGRSLDPEHHNAEAYVVTPPDSLSTADKRSTFYSSNHLGDVFVVQEQAMPQKASQFKQRE